MKTFLSIFFLSVIFFSQSCTKCGECFTPPAPFEFNLVSKATGENLFKNGTFQAKDIRVINLADSSEVEYTFIDENDIDLIVIGTIGWKTETVHYAINIASKNIFNLYVQAERLSSRCCSYTKYDEIRIENATNSFDSNSGIYTIPVTDTISTKKITIPEKSHLFFQW